jgi:threonyl-tRNA synthetase
MSFKISRTGAFALRSLTRKCKAPFSSFSSSLLNGGKSIAASQFSKLRMSTKTEADEVVEAETTAEDLFGFDLPTNDNNVNLLKTRHTTAHIMAMAVQRLHPEAQVTIGPWIDQG